MCPTLKSQGALKKLSFTGCGRDETPYRLKIRRGGGGAVSPEAILISQSEQSGYPDILA